MSLETTSTAGDVAAIADLAVKAAGQAATITTASGRQLLIVPDGYTHHDVTEENAVPPLLPGHISQKVTVQTVDSLVDYVDAFKRSNGTRLFADIDNNAILAAIDYHRTTDDNEPGIADHVAHTAALKLPFSVEWTAWIAASGKMSGQLDFARFLEENAADIVSPSGADLLDACRDIQTARNVDFKKVVRTNSDNECFEYADSTEARTKQGTVEIPSRFTLSIPVYFGQPPITLDAFLRWRLEADKLQLGIVLHRPEHARQAEFRSIVTDAADRTGCPVVFGRLGG